MTSPEPVYARRILRALGARPDARIGGQAGHDHPVQLTAAGALANAFAWFEHNSGWAPPDDDTLAEWVDDGVCRCPDECLVEPDAWCEHGLASWWLILGALADSG